MTTRRALPRSRQHAVQERFGVRHRWLAPRVPVRAGTASPRGRRIAGAGVQNRRAESR